MKLETFFEKFEVLVEMPGAVGKLRELVLELAMRGQLVPQIDTDESASALIARINAEKARQKIPAEFPEEEPSGNTTSDELFSVPANWKWIGATYPAISVSDQGKKVQTKEILEIGKYPVIDQGKVFIRGYCNDPEKLIHVATPLVVFGDHTRETKLVTFDFVVGADGVKLLQPICIDPHFYFLALRWLPIKSRGYARHYKLLKSAKIPLPPAAEQKRIVAKVDTLMALCDRLEAQQQERETRHTALSRASLEQFTDAPTPANLDFIFNSSYVVSPSEIRKAILALAIQGKVAHQDPDDEPASNLVTRAQEERRLLVEAKVLKKVKPLEEKGDADEFPSLPATWVSCRLDDIALKVTDGEHATPTREEQGHFLLSARNVRDGYIDVADVDYVGKEEFERIRRRCDPEAGDILLSCSGSIGRVAIVDANNKYAMVRSAALIKHSQTNIDSQYLSFVLRSPYLQSQIERGSKQSAQANLFIEPIRRLVVPIPPLAEQRRIVAKVDQLMTRVEDLDRQLAASRDVAEKTLSVILATINTPEVTK